MAFGELRIGLSNDSGQHHSRFFRNILHAAKTSAGRSLVCASRTCAPDNRGRRQHHECRAPEDFPESPFASGPPAAWDSIEPLGTWWPSTRTPGCSRSGPACHGPPSPTRLPSAAACGPIGSRRRHRATSHLPPVHRDRATRRSLHQVGRRHHAGRFNESAIARIRDQRFLDIQIVR